MGTLKRACDPVRRWGCAWVVLYYAATFGLLIAALVLCGCTRTAYVPVESVRTEYRDRDIEHIATDTVRDTRLVFIKGDTVIDWRDRWHRQTEYVHDTISVVKTDSIQVPYPVERKLSRWEQVKQDMGGMAIGGVVIAALAGIIALIRKIRKWKTKN